MSNVKETFRNRYGDDIVFERIADDLIAMSGYLDVGMRYGFQDDPDIINMVDPSGGPYIVLSTDMGMFSSKFKGLVVTQIILGIGEHVLLRIGESDGV